MFLEFFCFFYDPIDVGNLISCSSAFSKSNLYIWKFSAHVLLKPSLENFEHDFASMWIECNCAIVWTFLGVGMKTDLFQSCGHFWVFQICWHIKCSTFKESSFRIWNSSTGIPSPPLALFIVMLPKAHLTSHSRFSGYRWVITPSWLSGSCFCWLYRASPSLAAKNIINLISVLTIWSCPCVELSLVLLEEGVCYDQSQTS